jgi:protein involved in polysaccharide export with SLBB domain
MIVFLPKNIGSKLGLFLPFSKHIRLVVLSAGLVMACVLAAPLAFAQTVSPDLSRLVSPEMLRALQQGQGGDTTTINPSVETYLPAQVQRGQEPPSRLEQLYLRRSGEILKQFGYDSLGEPTSVSINLSGAVSDQYVLSANDELVVTFRGQENSTYRLRVSRDGTVTLPKLTPILAAGRPFGTFRSDLEARVSQAFISTKVYVSLGSIHQVSILVSGEVRMPGSRIVSGLASPLDVILLSGGIKKSGSLRSIRVSGPSGTRVVDLYSVVAQGSSTRLGPLRDGDTVYVPPLSATAAVAGAAARPGIFELPAGTTGMPAATLLRLAGGVEIAGSYNLAKISVLSNGNLSLLPTSSSSLVRSGEILVVLANHAATEGRVSLRGAVSAPGVYSLLANATVGDLFHSATDLTYDGYSPFALILRRDPVTNAVNIIPFSVAGAIRRTNNIPLQSEDLIYVLKRTDVASMASLVTKDINEAYSPSSENGSEQQRLGGTPSQQPQTAQPPTGAPQFQIPNYPLGGTRPPQAVQDLPPGVEPPPNSDATPGQSIIYPAQPQLNPNGVIQNGVNGTFAGDRATTSYNFGGNNPSFSSPDALDPRYRMGTQSDSSEAAALAQARALASRSGNRAQQQPTVSDSEVIDRLAHLLHVTNDALLRTASDNLTWVLDEVREPGPYLGAPGSSVADMIQAAGGVQKSADLSAIEVTSTIVDQHSGTARTSRTNYAGRDNQTAMVAVQPLDVIRLRPVYSDHEEGTVTVAGQVRYPGVFDITRNEHLSELLKRAGGLSEVAYPYGAIFTRRDAAITERQGNERSARELENEIPTLIAAQTGQSTDFASAATYLASLSRSLREMPALGRIVITADPAVLAIKPELDLVLQPGDTLFVPKRSSTVTVSGEVLNPGAFQYRRGLPYSDYVRMAGGATQSADDDKTFIIFPDGSSAPIDSGWFSFDSRGDIPAGSTIVVPRNLRPFNWTQFLKDVTLIASQLAITAASLSVLNNN